MTDRYFQNIYPDYDNETYINTQQQLESNLSAKIIQWINAHLSKLERHMDQQLDSSDGSVYTGSAGIALLYLRLASIFPNDQNKYRSKAKNYIDSALPSLTGKRVTFLCGDPGCLAIAAVIYRDLGDETMVKQCLERIVTMKNEALRQSTPDECLYGRAGYLYTLMYLRKQCGSNSIDSQLITEIVEGLIKSGERYARQSSSPSPLMYQWHEKEYLGAAHGVSGIIYLLLQICRDPSFPHLHPLVNSHLLPTVEFLKTKRLPSGNYLSSSDSSGDRLVQWCHGAPGFAFLFGRTYQVTNQNEYLTLAAGAADIVWQRGLLRKGYGLCHGTAGNAYVLLYLFRLTGEQKWLHRAIQFAEHCLHDDQHELSRTPDHPYSLFEGFAGTIYFMADILHPNRAQFPAFDL